MAFETERKFLVVSNLWLKEVKPEGTVIRQGYLSDNETGVVRVRIMGISAFITVKGRNTGITRAEFEYPVPVQDAEEMLAQPGIPTVSKTRYVVPFGGKNWEVDVFDGSNAGLILAEIELGSESEAFEKPVWVGVEVSPDPRYYNAYLAKQPFCSW